MQKSDKAIVRNNCLLVDSNNMQVGSPQWYDWLSANKKFTFQDESGHFFAQRETRRSNAYWYAYRRRAGKLAKVYLGKTDELTQERLEQASFTLAGQFLQTQLTNQSAGTSTPSTETHIDTSLLPMTKVNVPVLPQKLVTRPRLIRQLNTSLILIHAPSGFGKSTLLNDWRRTCDFPVAWLSLDENDSHPLRFWYLVAKALQTVNPALEHEFINSLQTSSLRHPTEIVSHLTNSIVQATPPSQRLGLVLDDFHRIHNSEIYTALQSWFECFPPALHLMISGHIKPPLAIGHLRARGMVLELDANDLRFTLEEGISYLLQYPQDPPLAYGDMEKLVKHTEGWAAGLTLAALALGKQEDRRHFIDTFSGAHIYLREYFMETVLQHSTPEMQLFLLRTAIVKHLTGSLCDALTGRTDGEEILSRLWREGSFIVRIEEPGWYRYHDLFAEMLYSQLQSRFPEEIPQLHRRAAQWYYEKYAPADAIYHLLATDAWEEAASLMEEMALRELEQYGEDSRLLSWLQELPANVVQQHKTLLFVYLRLALLALPRRKIESFIARIEANISRKPASQQTSDEREVYAEIQQIHHTWAQGNAFTPPPLTRGESDERWELLNGLSLLRLPDNQNADGLDEQLILLYEKARAQRNLFVILMVGGSRARRAFNKGQLKRSEKIAQQVLQEAMVQRGKLSGPASIPLAILAHIHFERNELDLAQQYLQRATEADPNSASTNMPVQIAVQRAEIQSVQGKVKEARATLRAMRELHARRPSGIWRDQDLIAYEAIICLRNGDTFAAEQLLGQIGEPGTHALSDLAYAEIALLRKQFDMAEKLLSQLIAENPDGLQNEPLLVAHVMLALALFGQHKVNQTRQVLAEAIRRAAPERFIQPFLEHSTQCVPLLTLVLHTENLTIETKDFIKQILHITGHDSEIQSQLPEEYFDLATAASITCREQEILRLLADGLSNGQMALHLSISESTVKTHLGNIYAKLDVNSRIQALSRAQTLGLV
ncbi:MAG: hypothetical protein JXB30_20125 [Anaerolineae bacterium]|nr:hypothetical protein [Anaerolineae bacterium]